MQLVYEDFRNLQFTLSKLAENGEIRTASFRMSPTFPVMVSAPKRASTLWAENENLPGSICFESGSSIYPRQTWIYEGGAILLKQGSAVIMKSEPSIFTIENGRLIYKEIRIADSLQKLAGTGRATIILFVENYLESEESENVYTWSRYPWTWERYLKGVRDNLLGGGASLDNLENGWRLGIGENYIHRILLLSARRGC